MEPNEIQRKKLIVKTDDYQYGIFDASEKEAIDEWCDYCRRKGIAWVHIKKYKRTRLDWVEFDYIFLSRDDEAILDKLSQSICEKLVGLLTEHKIPTKNVINLNEYVTQIWVDKDSSEIVAQGLFKIYQETLEANR